MLCPYKKTKSQKIYRLTSVCYHSKLRFFVAVFFFLFIYNEYNSECREKKNSSQAAIQVIQSSGNDDESLCQRIAIFCLRSLSG